MKVKCKCKYCGKEIIIEVPEKHVLSDYYGCKMGNSCNNCVPENSCMRDGINESIYIEAE